MEGSSRSSHLKRPLPDDDDNADQPPVERKPKFPKGKKVKRRDEVAFGDLGNGEGLGKWADPQLAAKERAKRRNQIREEELLREQADISSAEVFYEDNAALEDDGIRIEPFNLKQEREEGYFDANGNFVEFASQNEIKDAWLDSIEADSQFAEKVQQETISEEDYQDLSSEDIGKIKRNIANILQPGETIIQALKRLKGSSTDKRQKMTEITKHMFDQLTEDAMKLMENGEYNVYHEQRETFDREAVGYERLARIRDGTLGSEDNGSLNARHGEDIFSDSMEHGAGQSSIWDITPSTSEANVSALQVPPSDEGEQLDMFGDIAPSTSETNVSSFQVPPSDEGEQLDMFGEDDENTGLNPQSNGSALCSGSTSGQILQPTLENLVSSQDLDSGEAVGAELGSDYVYDPSTGYYYSSSLGYYYDPASQLYCCATSGKWYSFDENTSSYAEIQSVASTENCI